MISLTYSLFVLCIAMPDTESLDDSLQSIDFHEQIVSENLYVG